MATHDSVENLREQIDHLDRDLVDLLNNRARLAQQLQMARQERGDKLAYQPGREMDVMANVVAANTGPFPVEGLTHIFVEIMSACRNLVATDRVGVLGERYGWVHEAAVRVLGSSASLSCYDDQADLMSALDRGEIALAFLNLDGRGFAGAHPLLETLLTKPFGIAAQSRCVPGFCLATRGNVGKNDVTQLHLTREIVPVIRPWLEKMSVSVMLKIARSIEEVVENLVEGKPVGGIVPSSLARQLGLRAIDSDVGGQFAGPLRFVTLSRIENLSQYTGSMGDTVSVLFALPGRAGAMAEMLGSIEGLGMKVQGMMSFDYANKPWRSLFLLDLDRPQEPGLLPHLYRVLESRTLAFKALGCYPSFEPGQRLPWSAFTEIGR